MSDVDVMAAIIEQYGRTNFKSAQYVSGSYRITSETAKAAAKAIVAVGFGLVTNSCDAQQNVRLDEFERRLVRLEGWAGLPQ